MAGTAGVARTVAGRRPAVRPLQYAHRRIRGQTPARRTPDPRAVDAGT
ncbi:hypothetical protein J2850_002670 [Azospirillum picis]|uniref:Uncharacterized protein n=1 Tax=Azospirillum picis TaxID=488438 RepID=A0ABU0MKC0_9PROT|nr:hypothetical protein [Azospirillum picis]MDQ0533794.1 hypothetical protein [Azospirillum picis]